MNLTGNYRALVVNNVDPERRSRIQVQVPQLMGQSVSGWAMPVPADSKVVPKVGSQVIVTFEGGDVGHPLYYSTGASGIGAPAHYLPEAPQDLGEDNHGELWVNSDNQSVWVWSWSGGSGTWVKVTADVLNIDAALLDALENGLLAEMRDQVDNMIETFYGNAHPANPNIGDLWLDTTNPADSVLKRFNGEWWEVFENRRIQDAYALAGEAQAIADGKIRTFAQSEEPIDMEESDVGDLWIHTGDSNRIYRWDGFAWVPLRDAAIQEAIDNATEAALAAQRAADAAQEARGIADDAASDLIELANRTGRLIRSEYEPTALLDRDSNNLWLNTSTGQLYEWTGAKWEKITDERLTEMSNKVDQAVIRADTAEAAAREAERLAGIANTQAQEAKDEADTARSEATDAKSQAAAAKGEATTALSASQAAKSDAAAAIDAAAAAAADAIAKAAAAEQAAKDHADAMAAAAEQAAKDHADAVAEAERLAAIAAASDDATAKANAAEAAAAATAAADAEAKANAALEAAKLDATEKADAAAAIASGKADVLIQSTAPDAVMRRPTTLWIDTTGGNNTPKRWSATPSPGAWVEITDKAAKDAAAAAAEAQAAADDAAAEAVALKSRADELEAKALAALSRFDTIEGSISVLDGRITISDRNPTAADIGDKTDGAIWEVRSGGDMLRRFIVVSGAWIQARIGQDFIGVNAIGRAQILDAAVGTAQIGDAAITNAKIGKLAVNTAQIADAAITNAKIGKLAVNTAQIADAAVDTAKIKDLAVDTAQIKDLAVTDAKIISITAEKVNAGIIDADRIGARSITADKLLVGDLTNLFPNPRFDPDPPWVASTTNTVEMADGVASLTVNDNHAWLGANGKYATNAEIIPFVPDAKYVFSVEVRRGATALTAGTVGIYLVEKDEINTQVAYHWQGSVAASGLTTEWQTIESVLTPAEGAVGFGPSLYATLVRPVGGVVEFRNPKIMRQYGGTLIEEGAITTGKIAVDAINAGMIQSGSFYGKVFSGGTFTGTEFRTGLSNPRVILNSDGLRAYDATGSRTVNISGSTGFISGFSITGTNISGGTLTGNTITGNTISGGTISGGAITGGTITGAIIRSSTSGRRIEIDNENLGGRLRYLDSYSDSRIAMEVNVGGGYLSFYSTTGREMLKVSEADGLTIDQSKIVMNSNQLVGDWTSRVTLAAPVLTLGCSDVRLGITGGTWGLFWKLRYAQAGTASAPVYAAIWEYEGGPSRMPPITGGFPLAMSANSGGTGTICVTTSSRRAKADIRDIEVDPYRILDVRPRDWLDRAALEADPMLTTRTPGVVAEEVEDAGLSEFVTYHNDQVQGVMYDRLPVLFIPIIKDLIKRIETLEGTRNG